MNILSKDPLLTTYALHVAFTIRLKEGEQTEFPVWENVYIAQCANSDDAWAKAEEIGRQTDELVDESLTLNGQKATMSFLCVRRAITCDFGLNEVTGMEATYLKLSISANELEAYKKGDDCNLTYEGD